MSKWTSIACGIACAIALVPEQCSAQARVREDRAPKEVRLPLAPLRHVVVNPSRETATDQERAEIDRLIKGLRVDARVWSRDSSSLMSVFASNLPDDAIDSPAEAISRAAGDLRLRYVPAAWRLIELGPKATPALLKSIDDATPLGEQTGFGIGGGISEDEYHPMRLKEANDRERAIIQELVPEPDKNAPHENQNLKICRGDLCFVVLGQIVDRTYTLWDHKPIMFELGSPVHNPNVAAAVRKIWSSDHSATMLFDSLVEQVERTSTTKLEQWKTRRPDNERALARLAFYFPDETAAFFTKALRGGDSRVTDHVMPAILARETTALAPALIERLREAHDPDHVGPLVGRATAAAAPDLLAQRIVAAATAPTRDSDQYAHELLLRRTLSFMSAAAPSAFQTAFDQRDPTVRVAGLCAIAHTKSIPDWATTMLTPLLADASAVGTNYGGPDGEIMRVKDLAAIIILKGVPETTFDPGAEASDRDDQIKAMRAALERVSRGEIITATKPESFGPLTQVTFMKPGAYVGLDPKSDREHVYGVTSNGCGDEAAPRLLEMDVATGTLRDRPIIVPEHEQVVLIHSSVGGVGAGVGPGNTTLLRSKTHIYTLDHATCTARSLAKLPETDESSA